MTEHQSVAINLIDRLEHQVVRPLDDFFATKEKHRAGYLLHLHPREHHLVRVLGVPSAIADKTIGEWLREEVATSKFARAWDNREPVSIEMAFDCINRLRNTQRKGRPEQDLFRGAIHILKTEPYRLTIDAVPWQSGRRQTGELTVVQRVLAMVAKESPRSGDEYEQVPLRPLRLGSRVHVLEQILGEPTKARASTAPVTIAKLIAFLGEGSEPWGQLNFDEPALVYMPLRAMGQWRATFLWIANRQEQEKIAREGTALAISAIEDLLSGATLDAFAGSLSRILSETHVDDAELRNAFCMLWWADEVVFMQGEDHVRRWTRNASGILGDEQSDWEDPRSVRNDLRSLGTTFPGFMQYGHSRSRQVCMLRLDLRALTDSGSEHGREIREILKEEWGFDAIHFWCPLLDGQTVEAQLTRYSDQLANHITSVLRDQIAGRAGRRAEVYQSVGHWLKNAVECTGWYASLNGLDRELPGIRKTLSQAKNKSHEMCVAVERAFHSLQLFQIPASFGGLLRIASYIQSGAGPEKTDLWFTEQSLAKWNANRDDMVDIYCQSVSHLASVLLMLRGGKLLEARKVYRGGREIVEQVPVGEGLDHDKLNFPPLSKSTDTGAIDTLLPALIEPIWNAIRHLEEKFQWRKPLCVTVIDQRPDCMEIFIENEAIVNETAFDETKIGLIAQRKRIGGMDATRALCHISKMATIGDPSIERREHTQFIRVIVRLHPQRLHEWMIENRRTRIEK